METRSNTYTTEAPPEKAILAGVDTGKSNWLAEDSLTELEGLAKTAGAVVVGRTVQKKERPDTALFLGKGKVAEAYCQDQVETAAAVKNYIAENLSDDGQLDPQQVGEAVFQDNPAMQADYRQEMENAGFREPVVVDKEATLKKMRKHKLSTDTGIELVIPTEFFENTEFVEFCKDDDGFMSITLKNIQNITNK